MKYLLAILTLTILCGCTTTNPNTNTNTNTNTQNIEKPEFYLGGFDGIWVGQIQQIKGMGYPFIADGKNQFSLMLIIKGDSVKVLRQPPKGPAEEIKSDSGFHIVQHKTNAIIYSQDSESKGLNELDTGEWVETWNMTLTKKDDGSLYIYHVRAVNNFKLPAEHHIKNSSGRFFYSFSGDLKRIATIERIE